VAALPSSDSPAPQRPPSSLFWSVVLIEEDYADGLLDKENTNRYREYAVSASEKLATKFQSTEQRKDATCSMVHLPRGLCRKGIGKKSPVSLSPNCW
jgi:hypothetical protein